MKKESVIDVALLIIPPIAHTILCGFLHLWFWMAFDLWILIGLGVIELLSVRFTGLTLTKQFAKLRREKPKAAWIFLGLYWAFFAYLSIHLIF